MSYRVKTVAAMTGIPRPTLIAWERRHEILDPRRSPSGYRIYTDDDVAVLKRLKGLVDGGHPISEAVAMVKGAPVQHTVGTALRDALAQALWAYDQGALDWVLPDLLAIPFQPALDGLYLPILQETGDRWERGELTIAQEHFASTWIRGRMTTMFQALGAGPAGGRPVVCAMAPGELHELGLLAVAIQLALSGWRVTWLGPELPIDELGAATTAAGAELVCVSLMNRTTPGQALGLGREIRAVVPSSALVVIGGRGVPELDAPATPGLLFAPTLAELQEGLRASGR